jgi:hypothetical protein
LPCGKYGNGRIISAGLSGIFDGASYDAVQMWYTLFFWAHVLVVLVFLNYLPFSKHLHVLTSIPNVYCSNLGPTGALAPVNLADETAVKFGAADVEDFTRRMRMMYRVRQMAWLSTGHWEADPKDL